MAVIIKIDGLSGIQEMVNSIGKYSANISRLINGQNAHNLQEMVKKVVKNEVIDAGFNEEGERSIDLINAFIVERDSSSVKNNITYNIGVDDTYADNVNHNKDIHGNQREGLTGEEMISFMEIGRKKYTIPKNPKGSGRLVFMNGSTGGIKLGLPYSPDRVYTVPEHKGGAFFTSAIEAKMAEVFDKLAEKIEIEQSKL